MINYPGALPDSNPRFLACHSMTSHRISVIIPTWNRIKTLSRAIDSVLAQTSQASEIIVVDDGSTDDTGALIRARYAGVRYIYQDHSGVSAARNTGIRAANHPWIALLDSDDEWRPEKLEIQSGLLAGGRHFLLSHTNEIWIRNGERINQMKKHRKRGGYIYKDCLPLCVISPSSVIIHRDVFENTGLFNESLPVCEDYDMWLRICCRYKVAYSNETLTVKYGGHGDQLSRQYLYMDRFRIRCLAGVLHSCAVHGTDREQTIVMLRRKIEIYLAGARKHGNTECVPEFESLLNLYPERGRLPEAAE